MAGVVGTENDTAKRKSPEPVSNGEEHGGAHGAEDEAPEAKRRNIVRSCIHEVALPPGEQTCNRPVCSLIGFSLVSVVLHDICKLK